MTHFRRSSPDRVVRSRQPAHPAIITVEDFTQAQLLRRSKAAGGLRTARKAERSGRLTKRTYLFRGRVRCALCGRKMEASPRKHAMYYRCPARTLAPSSPALESHPSAVYLREDAIRKEINGWLAGLFHRDNIDQTVAPLAASQDQSGASSSREAAKKRVTDAETRIRRFQEAIEAGVDPAALTEKINEAQTERAAAKAELDATPTSSALSEVETHARIDSLGEIGPVLAHASPENLANLYTAIALQIRYQPEDHAVDVTIEPVGRVNSKGVGGGT
ncbi:zinc ribbon domain-containing protein [Halopolyspora algeriensis]|uniref:zinc ribbon domain-containing protein n=1 Tax=Halopolyspora algeriensis TaxID=1500506 RepID=UPI0011532184|nr:zinc ribbon domain-containing protein [Halopolyspora algeriensis]